MLGLVAIQLATFAVSGPAARAQTKRIASFPAVSPVGAIDATSRRFYEGVGMAGHALRIRHLDTLKVIREVTVLPARPFVAPTAETVAVDEKHGHLLVSHYDSTGVAKIGVIDGATGKLLSDATLVPPVAGVSAATWGVRGIAYDARTGGVLVAWIVSTPVGGAYPRPALYVSESVPGTGAVRWSAQVPQCNDYIGETTPVGRPGGSAEVYVACTANRTFVVRMTPPASGQAVKTELYPVPGTMSAASFAAASERMYLLSSTAYAQGILVFDGAHSKVIGLIPGIQLGTPGADPKTGRMYACADANGLLVADAGKATPVPLGDQFPSIKCDSFARPVVDPKTRRAFVYSTPPGKTSTWDVIRDEVPAYSDGVVVDPDASTVDMPEKRGVTGSNASASGAAYGSHTVLVGGPTGTVENVAGGYAYQLAQVVGLGTYTVTCLVPQVGCRTADVPNLGYANRSVWRSRVATAKLADAGATAEASSADRNAFVDSDLEAVSNPNVLGEQPNKGGPKVSWPVERAACSDFEGSKNTPADTAEGAKVTCARGKLVNASAQDAHQAPEASAPLFSVGSTTADVKVERDPQRGIVATATSEARNVVIGGVVRIASVSNTAVSQAAGRPGTAKTKYEPAYSGVRVYDPSGRPVFTCSTVDDCEDDSQKMLRAMNSALGNRVKIVLPKPDAKLFQSPRGAEALLARDKWEQLEEMTLNGQSPDDRSVAGMEFHFVGDNLGQSRVLLKLAGVQAEAHYAIFKLPTGGGFDPLPEPSDGPDDRNDGGTVAKPRPSAPVATEAPKPPADDKTRGGAKAGGQGAATTILEKIRSGMRWVFGIGDGFVLRLAAWSLLLVPAYVGIRRRAYYRRALTAVGR